MNSNQLWTTLALENNTNLISRLHRAERREPGFNVIAVPKNGFSENDETHNAVLDWLQSHEILVLNPRIEAERMRLALQPNED
jgi:5,10-methylenetetrahydrofolate reductase